MDYAPRTPVSEAWGEWVTGLAPWQLFGALTYDPKRTKPDGTLAYGHERGPSTESVQKAVRKWHRDSEKLVGRMAVVAAIEAHKTGWPHVHPLVAFTHDLEPGELAAVGQVWYKMSGFARLEVPRSRDAVAAYASKYVTKELERGDVLLLGPLGAMERRMG